MKKIIVFSPSNIGTIASCSANIIRSLQTKKNIEVYPIVLYKENEGFEEFFNCRYIVDHTTPTATKVSFWKKLKLFKSFKKKIKPDITISTLISVSTINVLSGGKDKKIGVFHSPLEQTKNVSYLNYILCSLSYRFLLNKLDFLYAVSETTKNDTEKHTGRDVRVVYNIHNFENIKRKSLTKLSEQESLLFAKPTVLYVGHLYDSKGVRRLIEAFAKIKTDANLIMVGAGVDGSIPTAYLELAQNFGISDRTFFLGYQHNPYKYMHNCTVLCLPSYSEGLPGVMIEALSLNKKIITTNSSIGDWEIMQCYEDYHEGINLPYENELGIITSNNDTNGECVFQLANAMQKLLKEFEITLPFDKSRFDGKSLVKYFILDNNEK